jgi:X-X-X-Leu-X-X-Gly heptad repeat protein
MTDTTTLTDDQKTEAIKFLIATITNFIVSQGYHRITSTAQSGDQASQDSELDTFLKNEGYQTTAAAVTWAQGQQQVTEMLAGLRATADSDRFVQDALADPTLMQGYGNAAAQVQDDDGDMSAVDGFLTKNGYDCTGAQVAASFINQQLSRLAFWMGTYTTTVQADGASSSSTGPAFAVTGPSALTLGSNTVTGAGFKNGTLTWNDAIGSKTSGSVTFGNENAASVPDSSDTISSDKFSGTLTVKDGSTTGLTAGTYSFIGTGNAMTPAAAGGAGDSGGAGTTDTSGQFAPLATWQFWAVQLITTVGVEVLTGGLKKLLKAVGFKVGGAENKLADAINKLVEQNKELANKVNQLAENQKPQDENPEDQKKDEPEAPKKDEPEAPDNKDAAGGPAGNANDNDLNSLINKAEIDENKNIAGHQEQEASNVVNKEENQNKDAGEGDGQAGEDGNEGENVGDDDFIHDDGVAGSLFKDVRV